MKRKDMESLIPIIEGLAKKDMYIREIEIDYGISERTVYRYIKKLKKMGFDLFIDYGTGKVVMGDRMPSFVLALFEKIKITGPAGFL